MTQQQAPPPSPYLLLVVYIILGTLLSYSCGRSPPGRLPDHILLEIAPVLLVICAFLISYSLFDGMAVGKAKQAADVSSNNKKKNDDTTPDAPYVAQRVLTNHLEQLPVFLVGSMGCALYVNGTAAAVLAMVWMLLRRGYATAYRQHGVGRPLSDTLRYLIVYTIPAYFVSHTMLLATAVHVVRCLVAAAYE